MKELALYGLRQGSTERWQEELLLGGLRATAERIEEVKVMAAKDGWHSFRVAEVDLSVPPDFGKAVLQPGTPLHGGPVTPRFRRTYKKALKSFRTFGS